MVQRVRRVDVEKPEGASFYHELEKDIGFRSDAMATTVVDREAKMAVCGLKAIRRAYQPAMGHQK